MLCSTKRCWKNLEDDAHHHDHTELECQRSARQCPAGAKSRTRHSALPPTVPQSAAQQYEHEEDTVNTRSWVLRYLLGNRAIQESNGVHHIILEVQVVHKLVFHLRHKSTRFLHGRADVGKMLHGVPLNPSLQPRLPNQLRHALFAH